MTVIVGAMPNSQWEQLAPFMEQLGWQAPQEENPENWYQAPGASSGLPTADRYLLLHSRPEVLVAAAMHSGKDPATVVNQWQDSAQHLLAFYKRNRSRAVLLEIESVLRYPQRCLEGVADQMELEITGKSPDLPPLIEIPSMQQLLANQYVIQADSLADILPELQASTFPLNEDSYTAPKVDILKLSHEIQTQSRSESENEEARKLEKKLKESTEENDLLVKQLFRVQEELETYYLMSKETSAEVETLSVKIKEKDAKIKRINKGLQDTNRELRSAQDTISRLRSSTSWKITAPIRALKLAFSKKK